MTKDKGIFIKNIYYMLAYAFRILRQKNYDEIAAEEFDDIQDLFAVILAKGVEYLVCCCMQKQKKQLLLIAVL